MMALETTHDWTTATLQGTIGGVTHTFTPSATERDAKTVMDAFAAWVAAQWAGKSLTWTWARDATTGGATLAMHCSHTLALVPNATATTLLGFTTITAQDFTGSSPAVGTWDPGVGIAVSRNLRMLAPGDGCGNGATRPGIPGLAGREPKIEAVGTAIDAARLSAVLAYSRSPRRAWVYQTHTGTWVDVALGQVSRSPEGMTAYRFSLESAGDVL